MIRKLSRGHPESSCAQATFTVLAKALPAHRPIALHEPWLDATDADAVKACVACQWVSTAAPSVTAFEQKLEALPIAKGMTAVATQSGTAALYLALRATGCGADSDVLVPSLTYVATANAVRRCGAVPCLYDSGSRADPTTATFSASPTQVETLLSAIGQRRPEGTYNRQTGRRIHSIVVVHVLGFASPDLSEVCAKWNVRLIQDTAAALGADYSGAMARADASIFSFNGNKIITTGGGGAVFFRKSEHAEIARFLAQQRQQAQCLIGTPLTDTRSDNLLMPGLNAALGCSQLGRLRAIIEAKHTVHTRWCQIQDDLRDLGWSLLTRSCDSHASHNHWLTGLVWLGNAHDTPIAALIAHAARQGVTLRPLWHPLHQLSAFVDAPKLTPLTHAQDWASRVVCLPSSPALAWA